MADQTLPNKEPDLSDLINKAHALAMKLRALLAATHGFGGDAFRDMSDDLQENFMWACSDQAIELEEVIERIQDSMQMAVTEVQHGGV